MLLTLALCCFLAHLMILYVIQTFWTPNLEFSLEPDDQTQTLRLRLLPPAPLPKTEIPPTPTMVESAAAIKSAAKESAAIESAAKESAAKESAAKESAATENAADENKPEDNTTQEPQQENPVTIRAPTSGLMLFKSAMEFARRSDRQEPNLSEPAQRTFSTADFPAKSGNEGEQGNWMTSVIDKEFSFEVKTDHIGFSSYSITDIFGKDRCFQQRGDPFDKETWRWYLVDSALCK